MNTRTERIDRGFTLPEILVVIVILGVLSVVVVFSVRGVSDWSEASACGAASRTLTQAAAFYMAQKAGGCPRATDASANRYELIVIDAGLIQQVSNRYGLNSEGTVTSTGEPCDLYAGATGHGVHW